jgi:DNA-binding LytR/AlgR family response regulator
MLKIAACDDEQEILKQIKLLLTKLNLPQKIKTDLYSNPALLLQRLSVEPHAFDLLLLDINIGKVNGIDLAGEIRKYNQEVLIVFITSFLEYAPRGYEVNAFRYILKPIKEDDLLNIITEAAGKMEQVNVTNFSVMTKAICKNFSTREILYLESKNRVITLRSASEEPITFYGKLDDIEQNSNMVEFIRPHKSYLINPRHMSYIDKRSREIVMKNGYVIPVSKSRLDDVIKKYVKGIKER